MKSATFNGHPVHLVENSEDIETFRKILLDNPKIMVGYDTETTGLDYVKDYPVGYCFSTGHTYSTQDYHGYYFPIKHKVGNNLDYTTVTDLAQFIIDNYKTVFWNRGFDAFMSENDGIKVPYIAGMNDAQSMMHLVLGDHMPALKKSARDYLKWDMMDFSEGKNGDFNFGNTDPEISFVYAAGDPLTTVFMARKLWREYPYIRKIYPLDNKASEAVRRIAKSYLYLDEAEIEKELNNAVQRQQSIQEKIFSITGYHFKINSNRDKADALSRFVTLTAKTKKGAFQVNEEALSKVEHPLAKLMIEHAEVQKYISSYVKKMKDFPNPFRCSYSACNVPTGRLSSGGQASNSYFENFNIQNVPKLEEKMYVHPCEIYGHRLSDKEEGSLFKVKVKAGLRRAFKPRPGRVWGSLDFISQEMVLMANFSREPNLTIPLLEGKDIHNHIAKTMFGSEDPNNRTKIKTLNFAVNYGANEFTISKRLGISVPDAKDLLNLYSKTLNKLETWKESLRQEARRKGMVFTYFGRPRVLYKYYSTSDNGLKAFADRSAVNSPVQGCIPLYSYLETKNSVAPMSTVLGKRLETKDGRTIVASHLGENEILFLRFSTGDFMICDFNHKFVSGSTQEPFVEHLRDGLRNKVLLSPKHSLKLPNLDLFKKASYHLSLVKSTMKLNKEVFNNNKRIASAFWKLALTRYKFRLDTIEQSRIRSLASIYGFNVKTNKDGDKFWVTFFRGKRARLQYIRATEEEGVTSQVGSCTAIQGFQLYPTQGFYNKNTGGDLIRLSLIKLYDLIDSDPEFAANVDVSCTVHDEINFYIEPSYLKKWSIKAKQVMEFNPENFVVPLQVSISLSADSWAVGEVHEITDDNKFYYKND